MLDSLTDLANRRAFIAQLEARATKSDTVFGVSANRSRQFPAVKDLRGHAVGDRLLRRVAARIRDTAPGVPIARIGGDEFALLASSERDPAELAQRIADAVAAPLRLDGHLVRVGVSIGMARFPEDAARTDALLRKADLALYRAKASGRGRAQVFEQEMEECDRRHAEVAEELNSALSLGEVVPHYQPLVNLTTGDAIGFEVLSRWESGRLGTVTPNEFIPVATETGLIDQLTCSVLERACAEAAAWPYPYRISFNLAPAQLSDSHVALQILAILYRTGLSPKRLEIELTEEALLVKEEAAATCLNVLKVQGITLALDDFGSGYSSLRYLRTLPFDKLKIDRSYISNIAECAKARRMVGGIINFAHALNIPLIAEGVETAEQAAILQELGCDMAQGWLYGKAVANTHADHHLNKKENADDRQLLAQG